MLTLTDLLGRDERDERLLDLRLARVSAYLWIQYGRDVLSRTRHATYKLQEADRLGDLRDQRLAGEEFLDLGDIDAPLVADIALDQVIDHVERHEPAHGLVTEPHMRIDQHLLGELNDRPVRATG